MSHPSDSPSAIWDLPARELLRRTASADPTPGGGSVAAVTAALGAGLVEMALAVTAAKGVDLSDPRGRLVVMAERLRAAADRDVAEFDALMAAYRLPRESDAEKADRRTAVDAATVVATEGPLDLAATAVEAATLAREVRPLVAATIVSDALAGRDLLVGAARAALRTAEVNLDALARRDHPDLPRLRARADAIEAEVAS